MALLLAEIGSVHDGNFDSAKTLITLAKECGADIVKFQTHIADAETLKDAPNSPWFKDEPRYDYFVRTGFSFDQWKELKLHADKVGIEFLSSVFSIEAVELLEKVGVKRHKIPSGEVTNIPLLEAVANTKKQVLISSGMSSWDELDAAVATIQNVHDDIVVMQCTSEYPCPPEHVGLNVIDEMRERYKLPVGFSDHTLTNFAAFAAVTKGIVALEKHLTPSRNLYGSDAKHSLEPKEFSELAAGIRAIETMLTSPVKKEDITRFSETKKIFEKSVVTVCPIKKGTTITSVMVAVKKPGTGIPARDLRNVIGKKVQHDITTDTVLQYSDIS